jgi:hypothetical protein
LTGSGPIPSVIGASAIDLLGRVGDDYLSRSVSPGVADVLPRAHQLLGRSVEPEAELHLFYRLNRPVCRWAASTPSDPIDRHPGRANDIKQTQGLRRTIQIGDPDLTISKAWGMLPADGVPGIPRSPF